MNSNFATEPMQIEVRSLQTSDRHAEESIEFAVHNVDSSFSNGLRRVLLAEVPILAIEVVDVVSNTSVFHDELLVHRMGLIPFASEHAETMPYSRDCECEGAGCDACQISCRLKVRCPTAQHNRPVYTTDLEMGGADIEYGVRPVSKSDKGIWLFTLGRSQEVFFRCKIRKGISKIHSRFMAVSTVAMQYDMDIKLNAMGLGALSQEHRELWVSKCPAKVFALDARSGLVSVAQPEACVACRECLLQDKPFHNLPAPLVSVRPARNRKGLYSVVFKVETTGALPAVDVVRRAVQVLQQKLTAIEEALQRSTVAQREALVTGEAPVGPTRAIGHATTGVHVPNQEAAKRATEDDLAAVV